MGAPPVERPQPQREFTEREWLGEIVVGAELEAGGLVIEPVGGGEHQYRHAGTGRDDVLCDLVTRGPRDVAVEDRYVVFVDAQQLHGCVTVARDIRRDRFQPQPVTDGLRQVGLILYDQHAHALDPTKRTISPTYRKSHTGRQHRCALTGGMNDNSRRRHDELRPEAIEHGCPAMYADPAHDQRMQQ